VEDELLSLHAELEAAMNELGQTEAARLEALQVPGLAAFRHLHSNNSLLCFFSFSFGCIYTPEVLVKMLPDKQEYRTRFYFVIL
jgi:hypothetical protein